MTQETSTSRCTLILITSLCLACGSTTTQSEHTTTSNGHTTVEVTRDEAEGVGRTLIAQMNPTEGNRISGTVTFVELDDNAVEVTVNLTGFDPGTEHGFHVHEHGDCSAPDGSSAGGHFNPRGTEHALPTHEIRHAGDLGNVEADETGTVNMTRVYQNLSLNGEESIEGRGVIVHAQPDDGGQPTGNAGPRISCGVIR